MNATTVARARKPAAKSSISSINPATGEVLEVIEPHSAHEVEQRLQRAVTGFAQHRRLSF